MSFLILGDANADIIAPAAHFPRPGDDLSIPHLTWASGGSAANVAVGIARLGASVKLLARVGIDPASAVALRVAATAGVDLGLLQRDPVLPTGLCYVLVAEGGERTFLSTRGANLELAPPAEAALDGVEWLHVAGHALLEGRQRATALAMIERAAARQIPVSLDLCLPLALDHAALIHSLFPQLRLLFGNTREVAALGPLPTGPIVVVKRGAEGCELHDGDVTSVSGFAVDVVDTTGCGDAFVAAFLWALRDGQTLAMCARIASAAGAIVATRYGAADAAPTQAAIEALLSRG